MCVIDRDLMSIDVLVVWRSAVDVRVDRRVCVMFAHMIVLCLVSDEMGPPASLTCTCRKPEIF